MLDLSHPQSEYIFAAARLEDAVQKVAIKIIGAAPSARAEMLVEAKELTASMRDLNAKHFRNSAVINSGVDSLEAALRELASASAPQMSAVFAALQFLDSNEGFGTVSI